MNWALFICGIALVVVSITTLLWLSACALASRREIPPFQISVRANRQPGETDSDLVNRLLVQSPTHQKQMGEAK
jgi:hypothetical protein